MSFSFYAPAVKPSVGHVIESPSVAVEIERQAHEYIIQSILARQAVHRGMVIVSLPLLRVVAAVHRSALVAVTVLDPRGKHTGQKQREVAHVGIDAELARAGGLGCLRQHVY